MVTTISLEAPRSNGIVLSSTETDSPSVVSESSTSLQVGTVILDLLKFVRRAQSHA
jgi:hypothetical protein